VASAMRRRGMEKAPAKSFAKGSLTLDIITSQAHIDGVNMRLSPKEFSLLLLFIQNEGEKMNAERVYESVWGQPMNNDVNAVKNAVSRLRKKLEGSGYNLSIIRGEGYCFEKSLEPV
jgi:DNA-binding response OmpR family regulator